MAPKKAQQPKGARAAKAQAAAQTSKPAGVAPVSFYGGNISRPQLIKKGDEFVRTGAEAANAPIIDWAQKADYKAGGARMAPVGRPPRLPLGPYGIFVKEARDALLKDPETRTLYRDGMPAAVLLAEAQKRARSGWKELSDEELKAYKAKAEDDKARYEAELEVFIKANPGFEPKRKAGGSAAAAGGLKKAGGRKVAGKAKAPRARSAFQIYVAECYADAGGKQAIGGGGKRAAGKEEEGGAAGTGGGLAGYLDFQSRCRAVWDKLGAAKREAYEKLSEVEKQESAQVRTALRRGPSKKGTAAAAAKSTKAAATGGKRKGTSSSSSAAAAKKGSKPAVAAAAAKGGNRRSQQQEEEREAAVSSDDDDDEEYVDAESDLDDDITAMDMDDSDMEEQLADLDAPDDEEDDVTEEEMMVADKAAVKASKQRGKAAAAKPAAKASAAKPAAAKPAAGKRGKRGAVAKGEGGHEEEERQQQQPPAKKARKSAGSKAAAAAEVPETGEQQQQKAKPVGRRGRSASSPAATAAQKGAGPVGKENRGNKAANAASPPLAPSSAKKAAAAGGRGKASKAAAAKQQEPAAAAAATNEYSGKYELPASPPRAGRRTRASRA